MEKLPNAFAKSIINLLLILNCNKVRIEETSNEQIISNADENFKIKIKGAVSLYQTCSNPI